jgi:hypothetical protein
VRTLNATCPATLNYSCTVTKQRDIDGLGPDGVGLVDRRRFAGMASLPGFERDVEVERSRDQWAEHDGSTAAGAGDPLDDLIGSAPGIAAAAGLGALRDEWQEAIGARRYADDMSAPLEDTDLDAHAATVGSGREVVLPGDLLAEANVHVGDRLRVEVAGEGVLRLVRQRHALLELAGAFPGLSAATDLEALRNEWER